MNSSIFHVAFRCVISKIRKFVVMWVSIIMATLKSIGTRPNKRQQDQLVDGKSFPFILDMEPHVEISLTAGIIERFYASPSRRLEVTATKHLSIVTYSIPRESWNMSNPDIRNYGQRQYIMKWHVNLLIRFACLGDGRGTSPLIPGILADFVGKRYKDKRCLN